MIRQPSLRSRGRRRVWLILAGWLGVWSAVAGPACDRAEGAELPWIEVHPEWTTALRERETGRPFVAVGVNYFGPHVGWAPKLWQQFDPPTVETHLRLLHEQGFNTIRVFLTLASFHREPGQVHPEGTERFRQLLDLCRRHELRVIPSGPDHWEGVPAWMRGKDPFADDAVLDANARWWEQFVSRYRDEPAILAWDLLNEPSMRWHSPPMAAKWNRWLQNKYETVERLRAAHGLADGLADGRGEPFGKIPIPPREAAPDDPRLYDFQLFRESIADAWTARLTAAIRRGDPNHLVTVGHIQWAGTAYLPGVQQSAGVNLASNAQYVDFVTIHFYPLAPPLPAAGAEGLARNARYLEQLLAECSLGKPVMLGEFGWYGGGDIRRGAQVVMPPQDPADQLAWNRRLLEVSRGRACGWLNWAFADTPSSQDLTRWSGVWTEHLELKPWGVEFRQFAREVAQRHEPERPFAAEVRQTLPARRTVLTAGNRAAN